MRRPIFWFLWPAGDPGPLDAEAVQPRWLRVCGRGPWRWAFLLLLTGLVATVVSAAFAAALSQPGPAGIAIGLVIALAIAIPLVALLARGWVAGTYVSDRGIKVSRVLATDVLPWSTVTDIASPPGSHWLGLPVRAGGARITVHFIGSDGVDARVATHVETASPDLWLRPQAFAAAADRLRTWRRETAN